MRINLNIQESLISQVDSWRVEKARIENSAPISRTAAICFLLRKALQDYVITS